jgi:hypothetical protein
VQSALARKVDLPEERGKQTLLNYHCEQQILDWIQQNTEKSTAVSKVEIKGYCLSQLKLSITPG